MQSKIRDQSFPQKSYKLQNKAKFFKQIKTKNNYTLEDQLKYNNNRRTKELFHASKMTWMRLLQVYIFKRFRSTLRTNNIE